MRSETAAANATAVNIRNGASFLKNLKVEQRKLSAPQLYLQVYNTNLPTVGTTKPVFVVPVPAMNANVDAASLSIEAMGPFGGMYFSTALSFACTTTPDGLTAPTAGDEPRVIIDYNQLGA